MVILLILFATTSSIQLLLFFYRKHLKKADYSLILWGLALLLVAESLVAIGLWWQLGLLWSFVSAAHIVNSWRFKSSRYGHKSESAHFFESFGYGACIQLAIAWVLFAVDSADLIFSISSTLFILSIAAGLYMLGKTILALFLYRPKKGSSKGILPTVSLLIPARNEDAVLEQMLRNVLQSDYSKLEIIVLDDCSHDRTPGIIRDFAHKGIRFYGGVPRPAGWLGKNWAMHQLAEQASGDLLLFCDVDVRLSPHSISVLVNQMRLGKSSVLSVMPQRLAFDISANILQPLTNFWQLVLPLKLHKTVPAIGSCWMVRATLVDKLSFKDLKQQITPEHWFARVAEATRAYTLLLANADIGITRRKRFNSQEDTMNRKYYPWLDNSPLACFVLAPFMAIVLVTPWVFLTASTLAQISVMLQLASVLLFVTKHNPTSWFLVPVQLPFLYIHELYRAMYSCVAYEFKSIDWKQRNVCEPMLEVIDHLPEVSSH